METIRTARKEYICPICNGIIRKGNKYKHLQFRHPKYDENDNQIGIEYQNDRVHFNDCYPLFWFFENIKQAKVIFKNCRKGIHKPIAEYEPDGYVDCHQVGSPTGNYICEWCGKVLEIKIE